MTKCTHIALRFYPQINIIKEQERRLYVKHIYKKVKKQNDTNLAIVFKMHLLHDTKRILCFDKKI